MFVTNWISPTKIQKISEITNFFRHYFLSRTEVVLLIITESNMTMIIKDDAKLQKKRRERRGFFGKSGVLFEKSRVTFNTTGITKLLHSCLSR